MPHYKRFEDIDKPGYYFATDTKAVSEKSRRYIVKVEGFGSPDEKSFGIASCASWQWHNYVDFTGPFVDELTTPLEEKEVDLGAWYERERATASPAGIISGDVKPDNPLGPESNL